MKKRVILRFKRNTIDKPVVYRLAKDFDLIFTILRANVSPKAESMMVMEIEGGVIFGPFFRGRLFRIFDSFCLCR